MTFFRVRELQGPGPASLTLQGPAAALAGPALPTEAKGGRHVPLGSAEALLTVNALDLGQSEFEFFWSHQSLREIQVEAQGIDAPGRPEGLLAAFEALAARGRLCQVDLPGGQSRRGVVRKVTPKLTRGYAVDPATGDPREGVDVECTVTFDWAGRGEPGPPPTALPTGEEAAGAIGDAADEIASAAADPSPFEPTFFGQLDALVGNVRGTAADLRANLRNVGAIAQAPAKLAQKISASARAFRAVLVDLDTLISDTPELYQAAGRSLADVGRAREASGAVKGATFGGMAALADLFAALDARRARRVGVRPGQSLADVAARELGARDRWPELAEHNGTGGQLVPDGVFSVEIPAGSAS
ncbi:MAG TPA: hypothetical protein VFS43_38410 [Polyangiaceae bacterium]|nr:hypothetical protein [Polyangiaceae bacterium]